MGYFKAQSNDVSSPLSSRFLKFRLLLYDRRRELENLSTMADSIFRKLRDGGEEGELAPALTIEEIVASPFALDVSGYLLANLSSSILAGKSKSQYTLKTLNSTKSSIEFASLLVFCSPCCL